MFKPMVLVTGAAGYIGSHTVDALLQKGEKVVALDNLSTGQRLSVPSQVPLIVGNVGDSALVERVLRSESIQSVIHFAASTSVEESTRNPIDYYKNNFQNSMSLIETCLRAGVRSFIYSSTCAVYGSPAQVPVTEQTPIAPVSPYGWSKFYTEQLLRDLGKRPQLQLRQSMNFVILRYFNVAGAALSGLLGQSTPQATQLIKVASEVICGKRPVLKVYGTDYPTLDGTCIRDYIHVEDLAQAHLLALDFLRQGGESEVLNCGYGEGYSVKQVLAAMKRVHGREFPIEMHARRPGDAVAIFADSSRIRSVLGWHPQYDDLDLICRTSLRWEQNPRFAGSF